MEIMSPYQEMTLDFGQSHPEIYYVFSYFHDRDGTCINTILYSKPQRHIDHFGT